MKLSPKASRFVAEAAADLSVAANRQYLLDWLDQSAGRELPRQIATLALDALDRFESRLRQEIEGGVDEDQAADLSNDIAFIRSVKSDLQKEISRAA
ncbi:MAG: hypothetical protein ACREFD_15665 [Stellaceae bacterium]